MSALEYQQAQLVVRRALHKAAELDAAIHVAVVDDTGTLTALGRLNGAGVGSIDTAITNARTARLFDAIAGDLGPLPTPDRPGRAVGPIVDDPGVRHGGVLLRDRHGQPIGAIGVSGSTIAHEHLVAAAGADALGHHGP